MFNKYDKRHLDQLVSDEQREINQLLEDALGRDFLDANSAERTLIAQRLEYSRQFDYGLYADGVSAEAAVEKLAVSLGLNLSKKLSAPSKKQLNCLLANLYRFHQRDENIWISVSLRNGKAVPCFELHIIGCKTSRNMFENRWRGKTHPVVRGSQHR